MKSGSSTALRAASAAIAALVLGGTLAAASPAMAAFHSPSDFNRAQVALRANAWVKYRVPYSQTDWLNGYRQDCSGFVSMAWSLGRSYVTWTLPEVAWPIRKSDLTLGDIMLDSTGGSQHVVIFDKWANASQTAYWEWELAGSTGRPVHRVVKYPFWTSDAGDYRPYRFAVSPRYTGKKPPKPPTVKAMLSKVATPQPSPAPAAVDPRPSHPSKPTASEPKAASAEKPAAKAPSAGKADEGKTPEQPAEPAARPVRETKPPKKEPVLLVLLRSLVAWLAD